MHMDGRSANTRVRRIGRNERGTKADGCRKEVVCVGRGEKGRLGVGGGGLKSPLPCYYYTILLLFINISAWVAPDKTGRRREKPIWTMGEWRKEDGERRMGRGERHFACLRVKILN